MQGIRSQKSPNRDNPLSPHSRRTRKRAEAEARTAVYAALTPAKRLALLDRLGETAKRERARIARLARLAAA